MHHGPHSPKARAAVAAARPTRRTGLAAAARALFLGLVGTAVAAAAPDAGPAPRWWRGNLHTHSLWSDGDGFPEMIAAWYRDAGYNFLAISDHNVLGQGRRWMALEAVAAKAKGEPWRGVPAVPRDAFADYLARFGPAWVETRPGRAEGTREVRLKPFDEYRALFDEAQRFLLLSSEEITHTARDRRAIHMNATNLVELITPRDGADVREVMEHHLAAARESAERTGRDVMVHVNHPNYKWGVTAEDLAAVVRERFFEVWNGVETDNDAGDVHHPDTDEIWDVANTLRLAKFGAPPLYGLATDDSHDYQGNKRRSPPGRAWVMVRSAYLSPEALLRAMRAGDFYASSGVALEDVVFDAAARTLRVTIRPVAGETYVTRFVGTRRGVRLEGKARRDAQGRVIATTLDYRGAGGPAIGEVLAEVAGAEAVYRFSGDELYVRAVVVSSAEPAVPSLEFPSKRAWTQPVGWSAAAGGDGTFSP